MNWCWDPPTSKTAYLEASSTPQGAPSHHSERPSHRFVSALLAEEIQETTLGRFRLGFGSRPPARARPPPQSARTRCPRVHHLWLPFPPKAPERATLALDLLLLCMLSGVGGVEEVNAAALRRACGTNCESLLDGVGI